MYAKYSIDDQRFGFSETNNGGVEISSDQYVHLMNGIENGKFLVPDAAGNPTFGSNPLETSEQLWLNLQRAAKAALAANDTVAIRCAKANIPYPQKWQEYDDALRDIVSATAGDSSKPLPARPDYPAGT